MNPGVPRLAVAASAPFPDLRPDWPLLRDALGHLGIVATTAVWTDPEVPWGQFDLVVANGAWDHIHQPDQFSAWAERTGRLTALVNSPATLRWGMDKHYLATLEAAGVATVPTQWLSPALGSGPGEGEVVLPDGDFVVKPTISGGGFQTARYRAREEPAARAHIRHLLAADHHVMVQPYMGKVDADGEGGLIFLSGQFSHAFRKGPLLRHDAGPQSALWKYEEITPLEPTAAQLATARAALGQAEGLLGPTTYARVDLVPLADGTPAVLELELVDPALYFEIQPAAADRFAKILAERIASGPGSTD